MLNTLATILEKKGSTHVDSLLNETVTITEKIDTFRIIFEKKNGNLIFYKKDNSPITLIERVLTDIYEDALFEIPLITHEVEIPEGYFFGLYYTPVERPIRLPYSKLPKYILTDVTRRDGNNKVIESLDYETVKQWASALCMGRPPILFEGILTEEQKKTLVLYDTKKYEGKTSTFSEMIKETFGTSYSQEDIIEGIVIKSKDKLAQILSYEFQLLNEAYEKENASRDFYDIIITDVNNYLSSYSLPILEAETTDELYISIVSDMFVNYCKHKGISGLSETMEAKYLTPPKFGYHGNLNKKLLRGNEEVLQWIEMAPIYEALYKVFVSSFRKYKKPYGLLTESIVNQFNSYVYLINNYTNTVDSIETDIQAPSLDDFLLESRSDNIVVNALKQRQLDDIDSMRVIASIQKAFEPISTDVHRGAQTCAVYLTSFDGFSNAQMNNIHQIKNMWNCPVVLFGVSNEYKERGNNFHTSDMLMKAQMDALQNENPDIIVNSALLSSWDLTEIFQYCRPDYEPLVIITDKGKKSEMVLQLFFEEEVMGGRINVEDKLNIGELDNEERLLVFRAIEDNNYSQFLELTPRAIHNLFDNIFSEYRLWSGQVIK